jgi:RimJ/RimL family protein N-acetyltransferase
MPIIRSLPPTEFCKYRDHLLRLSAEDRRLRFSHRLDDAAIEGFVGSLRPTQNHIFVIEDEQGRVVAVVQLALREGADAELAFSVDAAYRGQGLAHDLARRAILWARNRRLRSVYMSCMAENLPVRKLAHKLGMRSELDSGEADAKLMLPPPTHLSLVREMAYDVAALRHARWLAWRDALRPRQLATAS